MTQPMKLSPIHHTAEAMNAQFEEIARWQMPQQYRDVVAETAVARQAVALIDQSANGKIRVEGEAAGALLNADNLAINQGMAVEYGHVYRLRRDLFFVSTPPQGVDDVVHTLTQQAETAVDLVAVTDVTHGNAELWLVGPRSADLLSRLCGLDFHESQFPNLAAKQSSVAKTTQLIIRRDVADLPAYALIGGRSFAAYLWETILQAGESLDIAPIGQATLDQLTPAAE